MVDEVIKVHCIDQEYWFIRRNKCSCGGNLEPGLQSVGSYSGTTVDRISTVCELCAQPRSFIFDISTFFGLGRNIETLRLIRALSDIEDEQVKNKILETAGSPMENMLGFIRELGNTGDMLALDYLQEAIEYARNKAGVDH